MVVIEVISITYIVRYDTIMIQLAVFDWNGTLLADVQAAVEGGNQQLQLLNRPPLTPTRFREVFDTPVVRIFEAAGADLEELQARHMEIAQAFHHYYEPRAAKARTRAGARQMLETLTAQGITCVILSNHTVEGIYFQLERLALSDYFSAVLANENPGENHYQGKESRLKEYLDVYGFPVSETVIIGDTVEEVRIGKNLGLTTASITGGYNSTARLKAAGPDILVHKLSDIVELLQNL